MMTKDGNTKLIVLGCGRKRNIVKMHYFFEIFFSTPGHRLD